MPFIKRHITSQPCVSVSTDKVTLNRRTVDITAIFTVVPDAPPRAPTPGASDRSTGCENHAGASIALELSTTLAQVGIESAEQVASFSADGQYHHVYVEQQRTDALNEKAGVDAGISGIPAVWDMAHLMYLAEKDAKEETG